MSGKCASFLFDVLMCSLDLLANEEASLSLCNVVVEKMIAWPNSFARVEL